MEGSEMALITPEQVWRLGVQAALEPALSGLRARVEKLYLHVDLDVLDPEEAQANQYAAPGGLTVDQLQEVVQVIGERFEVHAAAITAYNPAYDGGGRTLRAAFRLAQTIVAAGAVKGRQQAFGGLEEGQA